MNIQTDSYCNNIHIDITRYYGSLPNILIMIFFLRETITNLYLYNLLSIQNAYPIFRET